MRTAVIVVGCLVLAVAGYWWCERTAAVTSTGTTTAEPRSQSTNAADQRGRTLYVRCQACHGVNGAGVAGVYPALVGNPRVVGEPTQAVKKILFGAANPLAQMPPMPAFADLSDADLAVLLTWIRQQWGNAAASVDARFIAGVRAGRP